MNSWTPAFAGVRLVDGQPFKCQLNHSYHLETMLQELRDKAKSFVSYTMLILLVISFGIWGVGDIFRRGGTKDWVAKVGDAKISPQMLQREFNNQVAQLRVMVGPDFTNKKAIELGLVDQSLERIVGVMVVDQEAHRMGFNMDNRQILKMLEETPQLRNKDGSFNRDLFKQILSQQGLSEADFVDQQRLIAARNLLLRGLSLPVVVPDLALNEIAKATAQKRVAELVRIDASAFNVKPPTDAAVLQKFYDENKENYKAPETRSFTVLTLSPADLAKDIVVTEGELKAAYAEHKDDFTAPEKRDVVQVVFADEASAKELAAKIGPVDLKQAAKALALESVKLDGVVKADLPPALADAVFAAEQGKRSGPVKTELGYHVFVVNKIAPGKAQSFDEAKMELKEKLQHDKAAELMVQTANKIDDMLAANKKLDEIAKAFSLPLKHVDDQPVDSAEPAIPSAVETLKTAFRTNENETSPLVESKDGGYLLVHTDKVSPVQIEPFDKVKAKVSADWVKQARDKKSDELAKTITEALKAGKPLASITGEGVHKTTSPPVLGDDLQQKDVPREVLAPLFDLNKGEVAAVTTGGGDVVMRVKEILPGDAKEIETRKTALKARMSQEYIGLQLDEFNQALRKAYPVEIDKNGVKNLFSSGGEDNG